MSRYVVENTFVIIDILTYFSFINKIITSSQVDCVWSPFGNWSTCSKTCGSGERVAKRSIITESIGGGKECDGDSMKIEACNEGPCPGIVGIFVNQFFILFVLV